MLNYIRADLYRIFRRIPRWILLAIMTYLVADTFWPHFKADNTALDLINVIETMLKYAPPVAGFIELIYVFSDDFTGKTAQIAIGIGVKRRQVIMTKWIDIIILSAIDMIFFSALATILAAIEVKGIPASLLFSVVAHVIVAIISVAVYVAVTMPIMFAMQNITVALLLYMLLSFGLVHKLLEYVGQIEKLQKFNIIRFTLTNAINVFRSRMLLGTFHFVSFVVIILYTLIGLGVTYYVYKNRELDF